MMPWRHTGVQNRHAFHCEIHEQQALWRFMPMNRARRMPSGGGAADERGGGFLEDWPHGIRRPSAPRSPPKNLARSSLGIPREAPAARMLYGAQTDRIRIISARRATRVEQHDYEEHITNQGHVHK